MGSVLFLASWAVLMGPVVYAQHLVSGPRLPFTAVYFGSIALTVYFAVGVSGRSPTGKSLRRVDCSTPSNPHFFISTQASADHRVHMIAAKYHPDLGFLPHTISLAALVSRQLLSHGWHRSSLCGQSWLQPGSSLDDGLIIQGILIILCNIAMPIQRQIGSAHASSPYQLSVQGAFPGCDGFVLMQSKDAQINYLVCRCLPDPPLPSSRSLGQETRSSWPCCTSCSMVAMHQQTVEDRRTRIAATAQPTCLATAWMIRLPMVLHLSTPPPQ